jgi:protein SCO1/2
MERLTIRGDTASGRGSQWLVAMGAAAWMMGASCCLAQGVGNRSPVAPPATIAGDAGPSQPAANPDDLFKKVRLEQKLNAQVPLDITFRDETGKMVPLRQYFGTKPVMMNLIQYRCTMLCSQEMMILGQSLKEMKFSVGDQFNLLTVSIDPREQPYLAAEYKNGYLKQYGRPGAAAGWHFLTGDEGSIRRLADAIGYHFVYDARTGQFAHPDGVIVLTPQGRVARYFFRLNYAPRDLSFALMEASKNRIGSLLDGWSLLCYHYNPVTGKYTIEFMQILRLAGLATVLIMGAGISLLSLLGRRRVVGSEQEEGGEHAGTELSTGPYPLPTQRG